MGWIRLYDGVSELHYENHYKDLTDLQMRKLRDFAKQQKIGYLHSKKTNKLDPVNEDHGMGYSHNVSVPGDENTMNKPTVGPLFEDGKMNYIFKDHKWLANMAGFGMPTDVYLGTVLLGVIESQPETYIIVLIKGPERDINVLPTVSWNHFKTKNDAAKMLHLLWFRLRKKDKITDL